MVNASGSIVSEATYDPYGVATLSGSVIPSFQYAGYYAHQGSGLNLTWYRSYDPVIGRWQARDPIGIKGGINLYGYVDNNVIDYIDPVGLLNFHWHGNYGGPGWSNGGWNSETDPNLPQPNQNGYVPPVPGDEEDACYQAHDYCIKNIGNGSCPAPGSHPIRKCDAKLHQCLNNMKHKTLGSRFTSWTFSGPIPLLVH
jgi:RHS repeat-associated protein